MGKSKSSLVKGGIIGGLIGLAAGILLAPMAGKDTRQKISGKVKETASDVQKQLGKMGDEVAKQIDALKSSGDELTAEARLESQELIRRGQQFQKDLAKAASDLSKSGKAASDQITQNASTLLDEGKAIATEAQRIAGKLASSAKSKMRRQVKS